MESETDLQPATLVFQCNVCGARGFIKLDELLRERFHVPNVILRHSPRDNTHPFDELSVKTSS